MTLKDEYILTAPVEEIIQVPMYQQLIDWFRDEQDIEITIMPVLEISVVMIHLRGWLYL